MNLITSNDKSIPSQKDIGGKAHKLFLLKKAGFLVPDFIVISSEFIDNILSTITKQSPNQINKTFNNSNLETLKILKDRIKTSDMPFDLGVMIHKTVIHFKGKRIIVRSSASIEDGNENSFAGIYESKVIDNNPDSIVDGIKEVLCSSFSERLFVYLKAKGIQEFPKLAIIIQEFVEGQISGVMFTRVKKGANFGTLINSNFGLASSVVLGYKSDYYFITKEDNKLDFNFEHKDKNESLTKLNISKLLKVGGEIESLFHTPQDVEWTISNSMIYILQSRPITTIFSKNLRVWDNSNIAESYSGVVLPLTISFARDIYKRVYIDVARTSGVSEQKIREYEDVFENLLGFFHGRFYYNILNWYRMLTLFPGYKRNKRNLDHMISAKSKAELDDEYFKNVKLPFKVKYYILNLVRYNLSERMFRDFKLHVKKYHTNVKKIDFDSKSSKDLLGLYYDFRRELINKWSITIDNDFLVMTFFGALRKFSQKNGIPEHKILELVSNINHVISADQIESLSKLSKVFSKFKLLVGLAKSGKYENCYSEIQMNNNYKELKQEIIQYLNVYGGRFSNELRLETPDLDTNPEYITKLLYLYTKSPKKINHKKSKNNNVTNIFLPKRIVLNYLIKNTKRYLKHREEFRLLRSQAFGHTRKLFHTIGIRFKDQGIIDRALDIFFLEVDEIKNYIEGSSSISNLKTLVSSRKKEYEYYKSIDLDNVISTEYDVYSSITPKFKTNHRNNVKILLGQGCSSGIIKGRIKILESSILPKSGSYDIIVTKHTDPGWTPLFGLCKGIIVEHGGVLSHAAIISRELNLPCIVGVKNATKIFRDGQIVLMNGSSGEVKIGT